MKELGKGDAAPDFELLDQNKRRVKLSDYTGKKVLVYFYPRADTPGCTKQACSVRDNMASLGSLGIAVVGISPDTSSKQKKFDEKYSLGFPLLSDPEHKTAAQYGVWKEKSMYGKKLLGILRSSFLIDEGGRIIDRWYKVKPLDTVEKAMAVLRE
jgi:peroxiredoxin Q/BCP